MVYKKWIFAISNIRIALIMFWMYLQNYSSFPETLIVLLGCTSKLNKKYKQICCLWLNKLQLHLRYGSSRIGISSIGYFFVWSSPSLVSLSAKTIYWFLLPTSFVLIFCHQYPHSSYLFCVGAISTFHK